MLWTCMLLSKQWTWIQNHLLWERMEHDDNENSSGCTHPKTTTSKTIKAQCIGGRRVRKLLGSKYWKATPIMLKEGDLSDTEMKHVYYGRKICYTRQRTERSSFKRRKLCEYILLSGSDGGMNREGTSNSPGSDGGMNREGTSNSPTMDNIKLEAIDSHEIYGVSGASSSTDKKSSYEAGDHNVKFSIKSFKVPKIFIEIPKSAIVGSLKKTVMEAVTVMLGSRLRVGVLQQGKKVRDDIKTLIQAGMSHDDKMDNLGFTLEPNSTPTHVPPLLTKHEDFLPPYDTAKN